MSKTADWHVLPEEFLKRVKKIIPEEKIKDTLTSFCQKKPTTFRANTLKISAEELADQLHRQNIKFRQVDWCTNAFILEDMEQRQFTQTDLYKNGYLYLQSLSSMLPPLILAPKENEKVLDLTAAPGSKTTQMAAMMKNTGQIIANDISKIRLYKLEANLKIQGVTNTSISQMPGEMLWTRYPQYFDKTLVDVPCSLEGTFYCSYPKSYEGWSAKKIKTLSKKQRFLLRSAISATKVGGTIVYSTCTLEPKENEEVVNYILEKEKCTRLENIELQIPGMIPGLLEWHDKTFHPEIKKAIRILPSIDMEGFFVAKFIKTGSNT